MFKVLQRNSTLFYTKGLYKEKGCEFEIVLDSLTAKRSGIEVAAKWFSLLVDKLTGREVKDGLVIEDFHFERFPAETLEGCIVSLFNREAILKFVDIRANVPYYRLILSDVRGYWPWEEKSCPECKEQNIDY